jgi:TPR repeat protein
LFPGPVRDLRLLRHAALAGAGLLALLLTAGCDNGAITQPADVVVSCFDADSCFEKGHAAESESTNPDPSVTSDNYARAAAYYEEACDYDHGAACRMGGMIYMIGISGVIQDQSKAFAMMERSCELEHAEGCGRLGDFHEDGWGVTPNPELAAEAYRTACALGDRGACRSARRYEK